MRRGGHRAPFATRLTKQRPDAVRRPAIDQADTASRNPRSGEAPDFVDLVGPQQAAGILRRQAAARATARAPFRLQVSEKAHDRAGFGRGIDPDGLIIPRRDKACRASKAQVRDKADNFADVEPQGREGVQADLVAFREVLQSLEDAPRGLGRRGFLDMEGLGRKRPQAVELFLKVGELRSKLDDGDAHGQRVISPLHEVKLN